MLRGEPPTVHGNHYRVDAAMNQPAPLSRIPVMIGGNGERKTLRMVAQYADESNLVGLRAPEEIAPKLEALDAHCQRIGRKRADIAVTLLVNCNIAPTTEQADADLAAMAATKGWNDEVIELVKGMVVHGDPDTVGERLEMFAATGIDGVMINAPGNGHIPGRVSLLGDVAGKVFD
jgi:alkanesulfonate monooxygenase SsuD/methylene tetrahydromethanopterin reductase-like flavin-dependent oxidoreductase (luciferase family)